MQEKPSVQDSLQPIRLPPNLRFCDDSAHLNEKLARQVEWMRARGIDMRLRDSERPRPASRRPRPGTVLSFSSHS